MYTLMHCPTVRNLPAATVISNATDVSIVVVFFIVVVLLVAVEAVDVAHRDVMKRRL